MDPNANDIKVIADAVPWLVLLGILALVFYGPLRRGVRKARGPWPWPVPRSPGDITDPRTQLDYVSRVDFQTQPLLNKSEYQVLLVIEKAAREADAGFRVMAQTSLGEILTTKAGFWGKDAADLAYRSINSKRTDFVVIDRYGIAVLAVEYQGGGHYQGTALLRDAVKREAFRKAGVTFLEIPARFRKDDIADQVADILRRYRKGQVATG